MRWQKKLKRIFLGHRFRGGGRRTGEIEPMLRLGAALKSPRKKKKKKKDRGQKKKPRKPCLCASEKSTTTGHAVRKKGRGKKGRRYGFIQTICSRGRTVC